MEPLEDQEDQVTRFLKRAVQKESTRRIYKNGLKAFEAFLSKKNGTVKNFFEKSDADLMQAWPIQQGIALHALEDFIEYMKNQKYSAKTINTYANALRALVSWKYQYRYSIPVKNIGLPNSEAESDKKDWNLEIISKFFLSFDNLLYQAILAAIVQSGLGIEDVLALKYTDIQEEFEAGKEPILLKLKRHKTGVDFQTFLGKIAVDQLHALFKTNGTPKREDRMFKVTKGSVERFFARKARAFMRAELKRKTDPETKELLKAKHPWKHFNPMRPHSLRSAFQKLLVLAGCPEILSEYWMGHETDKQKGCYILKGMNSEEHREQYRRFEHALDFTVQRGN